MGFPWTTNLATHALPHDIVDAFSQRQTGESGESDGGINMVPMHYMRALAWDLAKRVARDEEGATAVEYGIMVAAIAAVIVVIVFAIGTATKEAFTDTCTELVKGATIEATCS